MRNLRPPCIVVQEHVPQTPPSPEPPIDYGALQQGVHYLAEFGTEATEAPWLRAAATMDDGTVLVVPPDGSWTIDEPIIFEQRGISIVNPYGRRDYDCVLRPGQPNITTMVMASSGGCVKGINFWGIQSEMDFILADAENGGTYGTCTGLSCDRTISGVGSGGANLDMRVEDCGFYGLKYSLYFKGRNITVRFCSFDQAQYHIMGRVYTYVSNGTQKTSTRGIKIHDNVFHQCGLRKINLKDTTTPTYCIDITRDDTITEGDRTVNFISIHDNEVYRCAEFYTGPMSGVRVDSNNVYLSHGPLVTAIGQTPSPYLNDGIPGKISNNQWWGVGDAHNAGVEFLYNARHAIYVDKTHNIRIDNNYLFLSGGSLIVCTNAYNAHIQGNTMGYAGLAYPVGEIGRKPAILISGLQDGSYKGVTLKDNKVSGGGNGLGAFNYAVQIASGGDTIEIDGDSYATGNSGILNVISGNKPSYKYWDIKNHMLMSNQYNRRYSSPIGIADAVASYYVDGDSYGGALAHEDIKAAVNLLRGEIVYLNTDGKWAKAQANSITTMGYLGIVAVAANADAYPRVVHQGPVYLANYASSISPGTPIYVSASTAGGITLARPTAAGHVIQCFGYASVRQSPDPTYILGVLMSPGQPDVIGL